MKFSLFPEKITKTYLVKCLIAFVLFPLSVIVIAESLYPEKYGHTVLPYFSYLVVQNDVQNVVDSFQKEAPEYFVNMYKNPHSFQKQANKFEIIETFHENIFANGFLLGDNAKYKSSSIFGTTEYLATSEEFLEVQSGDCTEHSTVRYHTLSTIGYDKVSVMLGYNGVLNGKHAVAVALIDGVNYVMDINSPMALVEFNEWMEDQKFILDYTLDKNGLHIYRGNLYPE
jgi:hypothetical protein